MIRLHYYPSTAATIPHIVLEETGAPYERVLVDRTVGAHKRPEYLRLNPNGLLPALQDGDLTLYETAAIVLHLCDTHPQAGLAPAPGSPERAHFYKWLMWLTNTLQTTLIVYFYADRWVEEGDEAGARKVQRVAERKVAGMLSSWMRISRRMAANGSWATASPRSTRTCSGCAAGRATSGRAPRTRVPAPRPLPAARARAARSAARARERRAGAPLLGGFLAPRGWGAFDHQVRLRQRHAIQDPAFALFFGEEPGPFDAIAHAACGQPAHAGAAGAVAARARHGEAGRARGLRG